MEQCEGNYITFALLQIAEDPWLLTEKKMKRRSFGLLSSPVSFCFSRQTWNQLLRRKDMNIPGSRETGGDADLLCCLCSLLHRSVSLPLLFCSGLLVRPCFNFFLTLFSCISLCASLPSDLPLSIFLFRPFSSFSLFYLPSKLLSTFPSRFFSFLFFPLSCFHSVSATFFFSFRPLPFVSLFFLLSFSSLFFFFLPFSQSLLWFL